MELEMGFKCNDHGEKEGKMRNYVVLFSFQDPKSQEACKRSVEKDFRKFKRTRTEMFDYYVVGEPNIASVNDKLNAIIEHVQLNHEMFTSDFVTMYFTTEHEPDQIKQQMTFGRAERVESVIEPSYSNEHIQVISDLLEYDFIKERIGT